MVKRAVIPREEENGDAECNKAINERSSTNQRSQRQHASHTRYGRTVARRIMRSRKSNRIRRGFWGFSLSQWALWGFGVFC